MIMRAFWIVFALLCAAPAVTAQWNTEQLENLEWREIGPWRGGRSAAVAGIPQDRETYYFGATGGGVWKTTDGGANWANVSDGFFGGSIGGAEAYMLSKWSSPDLTAVVPVTGFRPGSVTPYRVLVDGIAIDMPEGAAITTPSPDKAVKPRITLNAPFRFTSITRSQASSPMRMKTPSLVTPALFTSTSTAPKSSITRPANAWEASKSDTSRP